MTWQEDAACRVHPNPEAWFPLENTDAATVEARTICYRCPVITECTAYALDTNQRHGIWGALTTHQRDRITKHRPEQLQRRQKQSGREMCDEVEHLLAVGGRTIESIAASYGITVNSLVKAFHRQGRHIPMQLQRAGYHERHHSNRSAA